LATAHANNLSRKKKKKKKKREERKSHTNGEFSCNTELRELGSLKNVAEPNLRTDLIIRRAFKNKMLLILNSTGATDWADTCILGFI
jgi:hypothetical protein